MATIASLAVNLIAQTSRFTQPLRVAEKTVNTFNRATDRSTASLERVSKGTNHARVQYLALSAAYVVATKQATEYAGSIMAVHKQTGLMVESVQALRFVAERSDTDIATLDTGLRSLVRRAAEAADGNRSFAKGFDRLGVRVLDAHGKLKDTETLLMEVADGAAGFSTEAEASAALMMVMGDAGRRLVPFMRQGSGSIRELMDQAVALGIVMDKNAVAALANLGDEIGTTSNRIGAMSRDIAYRLSPAASVVLGWVNLLIDGFFNLSAEQRQNIVRWAAYIGMILGAVTGIGVLARVLVTGMGILRSFGVVAGLAFSPLTLKLLAVGALVTLAITNFDRLKNWWETSDFGEAVRAAWEDVEATWLDDDLTLPEKALATVRITVGVVLGLVDSIIEWWLDTTITLAEKTAKMLGLDPEQSALIGFLRKIHDWWKDEDVTLAEKALGVVAVSATIMWSITAGQSFLSAVRAAGGLIPAMGAQTGAARWMRSLGQVAVTGTIVWMLLPDETKDQIKDLWTKLAERIEAFNSSTIDSPFVAGVAKWLKDMPVDGWELPLLTISVVTLGFKLLEAGTVLAAKLGTAIAAAIVTAPVEVAIASIAIVGIGQVLFTAQFWEELAAEWQAGIDRVAEAWKDSPVKGILQVLADIGSAFHHMANVATDIAFGEMGDHGKTQLAANIQRENEFRERLGLIPLDPRGSLHTPKISQPTMRLPDAWASVVDLDKFAQGVAHDLQITIDANDIRNIARMVQAEAEDEPYEGMVGVAATILNRIMSDRFPNTAWGVLSQPNQFEPFKDGGRFHQITEANTEALRAVGEALLGWDPTLGAVYFYNPEIVIQRAELGQIGAQWILESTEATVDIGRHRFAAIPQFAAGGWTGDMPVDQFAGFVHGQEIVIPEPAHRKGLAGILAFLGVPGFQDGKGEGALRSTLEILRPTLEGLSPGLTDTLLIGLDGLEQGINWAKEGFAELMEAIEDGPQAVDDAINSARDLADELETAATRQDALNQLTATMLARLPIVNAAIKGFEAGAAFGPAGSIIGALIAVAMESDTVAHGFRMVNEILGAAANALGMLLDPLLPLIYVLQAVLVPIFNMLGTVLQSVLLPIMPWVFEALKWLGIVVLFVAEVFQRVRGFILDAVGGLVWGIGKAIDSLLGWITSAGRNLMASGDAMKASAKAAYESADEMNQARRDLISLTYEEALARARSTEALEKATGAMINMPTGFKYALARVEAATARPAPDGVTPTPTATVYPRSTPETAGLSGGGSGMQVTIQGDVYGWDDFKRKVEQANAESKRSGGLSSYGFGGATT